MTTDSKLTVAIRQLLVWCFDHVGAKRRYDLQGGLTLIVYIDVHNRRHVFLSRRGDVGPSEQEAKTVLAHWPEPAPAAIEWNVDQAGRFSYRWAVWDLPAAPVQLELGAMEGNAVEH